MLKSMPDFLPPAAWDLTEDTSIALRGFLDRIPIATPLLDRPIATACVHLGSGGPPLLLLHGFDSSVFEWRRLLPLVAPERESWAIDLLGFGFTERPRAIAYGPRAIRAHLAAFWEQCLGQPVVLVGASMGGAAAIDFALAYPERVAQVVLIASVGITNGVPPFARHLPLPFDYLAVEFLRSRAVRESVARKAYCDPSFASEDARLCAGLHLAMPGWRRAMVAFTKSGGYYFDRTELARLTTPTLILWGEDDRILGRDDAFIFERTLPAGRLVWIPRCGHVPHLEQPASTARLLRQLH